MSTEDSPGDSREELTPAEVRLEQHLALLRDSPDAPESLTKHVVRTARWQQAIRAPLVTVAHLAAAAVDAFRLLVGGSRS